MIKNIVLLITTIFLGKVYSMTQPIEDINQLHIVVGKSTCKEQKLPGIPEDNSGKHIKKYTVSSASSSVQSEENPTNFQRFSLATNNYIGRIVPAEVIVITPTEDVAIDRYRKGAVVVCCCVSTIIVVIASILLGKSLS